jgi:predicted transcriptional regulator
MNRKLLEVKYLGKNRDGLSIIAAILDACRTQTNKTHIMFSANLSFKLLEKYLETLTRSRLIKVEGNKYALTEEGHEFISNFRNVHERYISAQKTFESVESERKKLALMYDGIS